MSLDSMSDARKSSSAAGKKDAFIKSSNGDNHHVKTTKGCDFLIVER